MKNSQQNMTRKSTKKGEKTMKNEPSMDAAITEIEAGTDKEPVMSSIAESKCYRLTRQQFNRIKKDLIEDCDLAQMGLDDQLLMTMDKYKLLPDMYERSERYYFMHDEMLGRVNRLLHNEMDKYDYFISKTGEIADIIAKAKYVKESELAELDSAAKIVVEDSNDK